MSNISTQTPKKLLNKLTEARQQIIEMKNVIDMLEAELIEVEEEATNNEITIATISKISQCTQVCKYKSNSKKTWTIIGENMKKLCISSKAIVTIINDLELNRARRNKKFNIGSAVILDENMSAVKIKHEYNMLYGADYRPIWKNSQFVKLQPSAIAIVTNTSKSKKYVEIQIGETLLVAWIDRAFLKIISE